MTILAKLAHCSSVSLWVPNESMAFLASSRNSSSVRSSSDVRDDLDVGRELGLVQIGQARDQLAFGEIPGRAEQHDDVGIERVGVVAARTGARRRVGDRLRFFGCHSTRYFHRGARCAPPSPAEFCLRRNTCARITSTGNLAWSFEWNC